MKLVSNMNEAMAEIDRMIADPNNPDISGIATPNSGFNCTRFYIAVLPLSDYGTPAVETHFYWLRMPSLEFDDMDAVATELVQNKRMYNACISKLTKAKWTAVTIG